MIVRRRMPNNHILDLNETFQRLQEFGIRLNPEKCMFGVSIGKFLRFMVSKRGIDANPKKVKALLGF